MRRDLIIYVLIPSILGLAIAAAGAYMSIAMCDYLTKEYNVVCMHAAEE